MNPDIEDPNNNVPPIAPGDNWDDLDQSTERSRVGLPPRRVDRGLPPKKESLAEKVSLKSRLQQMDSGEGEAGDETVSPDAGDDGDIVDDPPKRAKKKHGIITPKPRRNSKRRESEKEPASDPADAEPEEAPEIAVVLPHPKGGKRARVKEINPGSERPAAPPAIVARVAPVEPDTEPQEMPRKRRRLSRGERTDWGGGGGGRGSLKWMLLGGLGVTLLIVFAVVVDQRPKNVKVRESQRSQYSKMAPAAEEGTDTSEEARERDHLLDKRATAESIFAAYATARTPEEFMGSVYDPARNRELIESEWEPLGMKEGWKPGSESVWYVKESPGSAYAVLEGMLSDFKVFRAFFREEEGELKMDWKATYPYSSADFGELKAGKGDAGEVRVWVSQVEFYTFSYPEGDYRSFRITSPDGDMTIWGYVPAGSDLEKQMLALFQPGQITGEAQSEVQAVLSMEHSGGDALPDQWLIKDIVRLSWLDE